MNGIHSVQGNRLFLPLRDHRIAMIASGQNMFINWGGN